MMRSFSTVRTLRFQKESVSHFIKSSKTATPASTASVVAEGGVAPGPRWQPTHGNSFRSFAEYRLRLTNQSPLAIRSKEKQKFFYLEVSGNPPRMYP
ncbi:uncharacterized protein CANTADRAFT_6193 [Suhomyces tanzawaensis NRRL Y-17324]|uniref:Uncharacterized protein n=1 Tax=Suhomyces tanzawaensis NRRL Y-17324 TaxID=984487 RepID=A0A1E4SHL1_9ASCO|nr:uncharacterized protein CANTADRAFT_6193 [Suhomyces tanzawaensis NRRL Y-17324]ODV78998.1 hypothetical protein CANTADRAFT_6193 [Suhomyces tanzawaensis NRRL Y-17324]